MGAAQIRLLLRFIGLQTWALGLLTAVGLGWPSEQMNCSCDASSQVETKIACQEIVYLWPRRRKA